MNSHLYVILCVIAVITVVTFFALLLKIHFLRKSCREISEGLADLAAKNYDTNALLTISSRDRRMCQFTALLNRQLTELRKEHLRCKNGDRQIKEAITNISHDLRTPLTAVSGYLDLLSRELSASEWTVSETDPVSPRQPSSAVLRYLSILQNRTAAMKQLTEELFHYSLVLSEEKITPAPLSLNKVLEENLISSYAQLSQRNITPVISMPESPVMRTLDETFLTRIFDNILSNAVKYSGGDLEVTLTEDGRITFSNLAPRLTPVMAARLFDRYFTVEAIAVEYSGSETDVTGSVRRSAASADGFPHPAAPDSGFPYPAAESTDAAAASSGLGLSIAKLLTERMGGIIHSDCKKGRLYITVQFPR